MSVERATERRQFNRMPLSAYFELEPLEEKAAPAPARSVNISGGGILLTTGSRMETGWRVGIKLDIDSVLSLRPGLRRTAGEIGNFALFATGRIVRIDGTRKTGYEVAVKFITDNKAITNDLLTLAG